MSHLNGKHVVITGGSNGIGFATAERFAKHGAKVLVTGSSQASVYAAVERGNNAFSCIACDMSKMSDIDALAASAAAELGHIDIFFANAGLAKFKPLAEMTEALYDEVMNVNVKGLYFSIQRLVPLMKPGGVVVVTGSIAPRKGQPGLAVYGGSKGAARAIVRNLASELLELGIRINCLAPGPVHTNIFKRMTSGDESEAQAVIDRISATVPLKRVGTPEEIAEAVEFMTGPGAAYMVGSELTLDGGKAEL